MGQPWNQPDGAPGGAFSADWLALREPADHQARSRDLVGALRDWLGSGPSGRTLRLVDLGCGTGSNLRFLAPLLGGEQHWVCLDREPKLLAALIQQTAAWAVSLGPTPAAVGEGLRIRGAGFSGWLQIQARDLALDGAGLPLEPGTLVVASALLDLVSQSWLAALLQTCWANGSPLLAALNYDGRVALSPPEPLDGLVIALVNGHQARDKGLGPALGPSAGRVLDRLGRALGYETRWAQSDWDLEPERRGLQEALIVGWADAAREQVRDAPGGDPGVVGQRLAAIDRWTEDRLGHVSAGRSRLGVGHQDLLLLPPRTP